MTDSWEQLINDVGSCRGCRLCMTRTNTVPGEGRQNAELMFIGEGPGRDEDLQGRPFVGASGQLLDKMIGAIGLKREEVYIANVVKCRPPQNRNPEPDEAEACKAFLRRQFLLVRPKVIVLLGKVACRYVLGDERPISVMHGSWTERKGVWFMPTFHPSALLSDVSKKADAWNDFKLVRDKLLELGNDK